MLWARSLPATKKTSMWSTFRISSRFSTGHDVLDEDDHQRLVVGLGEEVVDPDALPVADHAPGADGLELGGPHHRLGLLGGVDVRHDDALRPLVQGPVDDAGQIEVHPDDGGHPPQVAGPRQVGDVGEVDGAVLALHPRAVEAQVPEELDQVGRNRPRDDRRRLAARELCLDHVGAQFCHGATSWGAAAAVRIDLQPTALELRRSVTPALWSVNEATATV